MIVIAVVMSIIGTFLRGTDFGIDVVNLIFGNFIGTAGGFTAFPLFNWFIFPVAGYIWCQYFIRVKDKSQFFRLWPLCIIVAVAYFLISTYYWSGITSSDVHLYYFMNTFDAIFCIINAHGVIGLCYWVLKCFQDAVVKFFTLLSINITNIYIAQWFYIPFAVIIISYLFRNLLLDDLVTSVISVLILLISTLTVFGYNKLKS